MIKINEHYTFEGNNLLDFGNFGFVFEGVDTKLKKKVALKFLSQERIDCYDEFLKEIAIAHDFQHPNVCKYFEIIEIDINSENEKWPNCLSDGKSYVLVMKLANHKNLKKFIQQKQGVETSLKILIDVLSGLEHLHSKNVIHRDLKPQNILLHKENGLYIPWITDFGISRYLNERSDFTQRTGTRDYRAPELLSGESLSFASDIYSIGIILFEALTYESFQPSKIKNLQEIFRPIVERCTQHDPNKRYQTAAELKGELMRIVYPNSQTQKPFPNTETQKLGLLPFSLEESTEGLKKGLELYSSGNYIEAYECYLKEAYRFNANAFINVGLMNYNGEGVQQNYEAAYFWWKLAENANIPIAFNNIGVLFQKGLGVKQSYEKAIEYYNNGVSKDEPYSLYNLGWLYQEGLGVKQSYEKARFLYEQAIERKQPDAFYSLGNLYFYGIGVTKNYELAAKYYANAMLLNHINSFIALGWCYHYGLGVEINYEYAKECYEYAASKNDSMGLNNLGLLYAEGLGVAINHSKAFEYYEKAAALNNSYGFNNLGFSYQKGLGVPIDYEIAKYYYEIGYELNNPVATYNLGYLYFEGLGVDINYEYAKEYFEKAIEMGHEKTEEILKILEMIDNPNAEID